MQYDLSLKMGYTYQIPASNARHMLRLLPLSLPGRQRLVAGSLTISPTPEEQTHFVDFFLHPTTSLLVRKPHEKLEIRMKARVHVESLPDTADFSPLLDDLADEIADCWSVDGLSPHHFLAASPRLPDSTEISGYARPWASSKLTVMQIAREMNAKIHKDFTYDGKATNVDTTPNQAFKLKRGVCQDFSHIMIIALRSLGIPAGYVSGFLRTIPPPGKARLEGADAMHAWVRVWCGVHQGWLEFDPTNAMLAGADHITIGHGRDYSDISPIIGVLRTSGDHKAKQSVDVVRVE